MMPHALNPQVDRRRSSASSSWSSAPATLSAPRLRPQPLAGPPPAVPAPPADEEGEPDIRAFGPEDLAAMEHIGLDAEATAALRMLARHSVTEARRLIMKCFVKGGTIQHPSRFMMRSCMNALKGPY